MAASSGEERDVRADVFPFVGPMSQEARRRLESQCVMGDIVSDMHTHQELRCLQCHADLTKQGHGWLCSHHPTAPVCEECGENLRANGHKGTCSQSVMQAGSLSGSFTMELDDTDAFFDPARFATITVVMRARWWKRPFLWLLGKPTSWSVTYLDARFTGLTVDADGTMHADFTSGYRT